MSEAPSNGAAPSLAAAASEGLCPNCGARTLFVRLVSFAPSCSNCGLDYSSYNVGDGPAAFLILIVGAIVAVGAILFDLLVVPPWWAHLIWLPIAAGLTIGGLRIGKAALLYQEYKHRAGEGRLSK
jgi:uncharacterized protein (DUF983 family)